MAENIGRDQLGIKWVSFSPSCTPIHLSKICGKTHKLSTALPQPCSNPSLPVAHGYDWCLWWHPYAAHSGMGSFRCWSHNLYGCCIVSPQLWMDISCSRTGPLALRPSGHSIYVAWPSMTYGILTLIHCCLPPSNHFASVQIASIWADHLWTKHPWLIPRKLGYHPQISWPQPNLWHLSLLRKCGECSGRERQ